MLVRRGTLLLGLVGLPAAALADPPQGRGGGQGGGQGNQGDRGRGNQGGGNQGGGNQGGGQGRGQGRGDASLGAPELNVIQSWLLGNPGFTAQPLPPGMQNRLARGKPLPPGIARRAVPPDLLARLPRKPGYDYALVGASLVLIEVATGAVAGLLADALLRR